MTEWSRLLPEHGWSVVVAARSYGYAASPEAVARHLHPGIVVRYLSERAAVVAGGRRGRRTLRQRIGASQLGRLIVPDASAVFWVAKRRLLQSLVEEVQPDVVLTSSPPHSIHGAGRWVSRKAGLPWVADFRDPYMTDPRYRPRGIARAVSRLHERYERGIYDDAALVIHAIPSQTKWAESRYPNARMMTLTNGAPPEMLDGTIEPIVPASGRTSVRVVGSGGESELLIVALALRNMLIPNSEPELRIVGAPPGNHRALTMILGERLVLTGPKAHPEALREIAGADVLIAPLSVERAKVHGLSSKLFEYAAAPCPIILINPSAADAELAAELSGVVVLHSPDMERVQGAVRAALDIPAVAIQRRHTHINAMYRRDRQVEKLATVLDQLVGDRV